MSKNCLVCHSNINITTSVNVNNTSVKYSNEKLVSIVLNILGPYAPVSDDTYICSKCYSLFKLYEQAQWTARSMEREILKIYNSNINKNIFNQEETIIFKEEDILLPNDSEIIDVSVQNVEEENNINQFCNINVPSLIPDMKKGRKKKSSEKYSLKNYFENVGNGISQTSDQSNLNKSTDKVCVIKKVESIKVNFKQNESLLLNETKSNNIIVSLQPMNSASSNLSVSSNKVYTFLNTNYESTISDDAILTKEIIQNGTGDDISIVEHDIKPIVFEVDAGKSKSSEKLFSLTCPSCKKEFENKTALRNHVKCHSELRPFMCEICGHSYRHKQALEIHLGMHNGINPFQCSHCAKCFTQKGTLMRHMLLHTGETPYQCEICGKRFVHHTSYNMHTLSHTREKAYKCHICELSLLSTSHLKRHMRVHTGEKPYSCPICFKSFAQRYNLLTHQKIHTNKRTTKSKSKVVV